MTDADRPLLSRIEDAGLNASAPQQQLWLDGWLLRLCPGKAKRARCVNALAAGQLSFDDRLAAAQALFAAAGLPFVVRITPFSQPANLDAELAGRGLAVLDDTRVMHVQLAHADVGTAIPAGLQLERATSDDFAELVGAMRESPPAQRRAHAERLRASPVAYEGWVLRHGGSALACGQIAVETDRVGLYDIFTASAERGRGLATALCAHLLRVAMARGARVGYLQVDAGNEPARHIYRKMGFRDGYTYHYRAFDPAAA